METLEAPAKYGTRMGKSRPRKIVSPAVAAGPEPEPETPPAPPEPQPEPAAPPADEPVTEQPPVEPVASVRFQFNSFQKIPLPDGTEYIARIGIHDISNPVLIKNLTAIANDPNQKRQIFIL